MSYIIDRQFLETPPGFDSRLVYRDFESFRSTHVLLKMYPDIVDRDYELGHEFTQFLDRMNSDQKFNINSKNQSKRSANNHFQKHRDDLQNLGIKMDLLKDFFISINKFAHSVNHPYRITFSSNQNHYLYKVDLRDGRVLVMSKKNNKFITYYVWRNGGKTKHRHVVDKAFFSLSRSVPKRLRSRR